MTPNQLEHEPLAHRSVEDSGTRARIYLQPIAAPSILGLFGLAGATFMVAAHMAGWYGGPTSAYSLMPFVLMFGGVAQFLAAMWAFRARDGVATALHGLWGSFWMGYGILVWMMVTGRVANPGLLYPEIGYWFIVAAAITWMVMLAAFAENLSLVWVLGALGAGSTLGAIARLTGSDGCQIAAGYLFIIAAIIAWYTASALMFEEAFGHSVLKLSRRRSERGLTIPSGEPGVIRGQ